MVGRSTCSEVCWDGPFRSRLDVIPRMQFSSLLDRWCMLKRNHAFLLSLLSKPTANLRLFYPHIRMHHPPPLAFHYDSVCTLPLGFVTFTPSCFALAMMSIRFFDETAWPILGKSVSAFLCHFSFCRIFREDVLSGVGLVVHQEEVDVARVLDEEGLVARGHHVARLLVGAIADL